MVIAWVKLGPEIPWPLFPESVILVYPMVYTLGDLSTGNVDSFFYIFKQLFFLCQSLKQLRLFYLRAELCLTYLIYSIVTPYIKGCKTEQVKRFIQMVSNNNRSHQ
jgi:hypothetical protein